MAKFGRKNQVRPMKNIAIFASGSGTNAENIARHFQDRPDVQVAVILSNNANAYVLERAKNLGIPYYVFSKSEFYQSDSVLLVLRDYRVDLIVLAGFLWLVPGNLLKAFASRIINIHPALLPKFGGKGMYGDKVHQAVIASGEKYTGITIHFVNEVYDEGEIIFQEKFEIAPGDTPESIAAKVHKLEYAHYPRVIEEVLKRL